MAGRKLIKGNVAICYGAVAARCDAFSVIQSHLKTKIPEYMSELMPAHGKVFLQAESELAAINMVYGAACAGQKRANDFVI